MNERIILYKDKSDCCSCWACQNVCPKKAISMIEDNQGFFFPSINHQQCIKCGLCLKTCPIKTRVAEKQIPSTRKYIKIVNLYTTNNYGASIAAVCLEEKIREIVSPSIIVKTLLYNNNVDSKDHPIRYMIETFHDCNGIINYLDLKIHPAKNIISESDINTRSYRFYKYHRKYLDQTLKMNNFDLQNDSDNNVALICGSDVIWHTKRIISNNAYAFGLNFGDDHAVRIAYAPSIDSKSCFKLSSKTSQYKKKLKKLDYVSVRENESIAFIEKVTKKTVQQCCDPVFLFEPQFFEKMIAEAVINNSEEDYIYAYVLDQNDYIVEYVKDLSKKKGLKVYFYSNKYNNFGDNSESCNSDGPCEFLHRVKNAKYIITTSYHCVVFSLLFKKQFVAFQRNKYSIKTPDLLKLTGLTERLTKTNNAPDIDKEIDFDNVNRSIEKLKKSSVGFLENALKDLR